MGSTATLLLHPLLQPVFLRAQPGDLQSESLPLLWPRTFYFRYHLGLKCQVGKNTLNTCFKSKTTFLRRSLNKTEHSGMTFTTLTFPIFLAIVFTLYWSVRSHVAQNRVLLLASYTFYAWWDWRFCFLMLASSLVDFELSKRIDRCNLAARRRALLSLSIFTNLGLLSTFKYYNFFLENLIQLTSQFGWSPNLNTLSIILPLGISFYTFQTLGYTIDVFRKKIPAATSLVQYLAFVSFFPQLVAGPIERAQAMLPQFSRRRYFDFEKASDGSRQILWGFFKKIVIADRLAIAVNPVFEDPTLYSGPHLMMASVFFAFQIYCDFSAYSDIAIGTARLFNLQLSKNFAYPYFSQSINEFWRRWHISLSFWFRDYIYIPLGGSRKGPVRRRFNLLVTFLISGLWHGAAWRFVAWGGFSGLAVGVSTNQSKLIAMGDEPNPKQSTHHRNQVIETKSSDPVTVGGDAFLPHPATLLRIYMTFAIICVAWILFRANSLEDAWFIYRQIAGDLINTEAYRDLIQLMNVDHYQRKTACILLAFVCWEWIFRRDPYPFQLKRVSVLPRWTLYTLLIWGGLYLMARTGTGEFVYFEF